MLEQKLRPLFQRRDGYLYTPPVYFYDPKEEYRDVFGVPVKYVGSALGEYPFLRFASALDAVIQAQTRPYSDCVVVIEELLTVPRKEYDEIRRFIAMHRHYKALVLCATQRPRQIPVELRSLADETHIGLIDDPDDLKAIKHLLSPEDFAKIPHLSRESIPRKWFVYKT